jgi:uncharacterized Zn-binding protein involved in type VI secretion
MQKTESNSAIKATHWLATIGSLTKRGGRITKATGCRTIAGLTVARVGDIVTYEDGSEAVIVDGAGAAAISEGKPLALVGSRLSNGDQITESLQHRVSIVEHRSQTITGLFDPAYVPPPAEPWYRLAARGATTARGGVLRTPSSTWALNSTGGNAGALGDPIHYPDGSTANIVSGLGLKDHPEFQPLAFVGSRLDNGDTITDSPERAGSASPNVFVVVSA